MIYKRKILELIKIKNFCSSETSVKKVSWLGRVGHSLILTLGRQKQVDLREIQASLFFI